MAKKRVYPFDMWLKKGIYPYTMFGPKKVYPYDFCYKKGSPAKIVGRQSTEYEFAADTVLLARSQRVYHFASVLVHDVLRCLILARRRTAMFCFVDLWVVCGVDFFVVMQGFDLEDACLEARGEGGGAGCSS